MAKAVVLFTNGWPREGGGGGGIVRSLLQQFCAKWPRLRDCHLYCLFGEYLVRLDSAADTSQLLSQPSRVFPVPFPRFINRSAKWFNQARIVRRIADSHDATVVLSHEPFFGRRFAPRHRLFVAHVEHSKGGVHTEYLAAKGRKDPLYHTLRFLATQAVSSADRLVFPSRGAIDLYQRSNAGLGNPDRISVIYNGVDDPVVSTRPHANSAVRPQALTVVNVANHVPEKNIELIIRGLALRKSRTQSTRKVRFLNFGQTGTATPQLERLVSELGLENDCYFHGFKPKTEVLAAIKDADVFALTPNVAVFDLALLEAMALSKPVLSTAVGGNLEALGAGYEGYVGGAADFADKLERVITQNDFRLALGAANRRRYLQQFTREEMADRYLSLIREGLDEIQGKRLLAA